MRKTILLVSLLILQISAFAQSKLVQILQEAERPSINNFYTELQDEQDNHSSIPISVIKGIKEGPTFTVVAGVHGFEYPPIVASQALIQEIDPEKLNGTLIIIPLANPTSFYSRTPFLNPDDQLNLNRVFPGDQNGTITERIADYITKEVIANSDVFVDIHGGDANEDLMPFVCYYNNESKVEQTKMAQRLSEGSGFQHVVSYGYTLKDDQPAKYAFKQAVQDGKVGLSIEAGRLGNVHEKEVMLIKEGLYNMLEEMKMYYKIGLAKRKFISLTQQSYIRSEYKGLFYSNYKAGEQIKKGAIVGKIKNAFGEVLAEIKAPKAGTILYKIGTPPVNIGETIMCIAY